MHGIAAMKNYSFVRMGHFKYNNKCTFELKMYTFKSK